MIKFANNLVKIFLELFVFDRKLRARLKTRFAKAYLKKYVDYGIKIKTTPQSEYKGNDIIWQYWHQGIDDAPELIKKCFESVRNHMPGKKQVIITFDTIKDYIELPKRYYDLLENKKIPIAIFSDILRVYLLNKYGGSWVDSTIYLTDKIPDDIMNSNFCVLQKILKQIITKTKCPAFLFIQKAIPSI